MESFSNTQNPDSKINQLAFHYEKILELIGENPKREGLIKTPKRAAKAMIDLTLGYQSNLDELLNNAVFNADNKNMVIAKNIEFHSLCEHHLLPFSGKVHVGYIPNGKVIGLSKIPRLVDMFSRRLQIQENLSDQIAYSLMNLIKADGVGVIINAKHSCVSMRGIEKQCSDMTTSTMIGSFLDNPDTRKEFLTLISI